jgi:hypothetical protein
VIEDGITKCPDIPVEQLADNRVTFFEINGFLYLYFRKCTYPGRAVYRRPIRTFYKADPLPVYLGRIGVIVFRIDVMGIFLFFSNGDIGMRTMRFGEKIVPVLQDDE